MKTLIKQRGFLLNPARFGGSVFQGNLSASATSAAGLRGASIASGVARAEGASSLTLSDDQLGAGAFSATSESGATHGGAAIAAGSASAAGESVATLYAAAPAITCDAADFDGTNDYMRRGGGLTGAADSKSGIVSFWYRIDGGDGDFRTLLHGATTLAGSTSRFRVRHENSNLISVTGVNAAGTTILSKTTNSSFSAAATWRHVLCSWDLAASAFNLYVGDASDAAGGGTLTDDTIDYTLADWAVGGQASGLTRMNGCLAEFYFAPGQYLDFSVEENRRKFITSTGDPVDLGPTGASPTGTPPLVYLHLDDGEAAANFASNAGTGGNFTITGTLDTASSSPSD